jgi:hypothetical protein
MLLQVNAEYDKSSLSLPLSKGEGEEPEQQGIIG